MLDHALLIRTAAHLEAEALVCDEGVARWRQGSGDADRLAYDRARKLRRVAKALLDLWREKDAKEARP